MPAKLILPHAVAGDEYVIAGPWTELTADGPRPLGQELPHWDYSTDLTLRRELSLDLGGVRRSCQLAAEDPIMAVVLWRASGTTLRGVTCAGEIEGESTAITCSARLNGPELAGALHLETQLVLGSEGHGEHPLAARRVGSILWRDVTTVILEGVAARFPVEVIDFAESGIPAKDAAWYLEWPRGRLQESATGETRLYINRRRERIVEAVARELPDETGAAIWSAIKHDVGRTLIEGTLEDEEFLDDPEAYEDGSMGASVRRMLTMLWPEEEPRGLAGRMRQTPADFAADLQQRLRLFEEL